MDWRVERASSYVIVMVVDDVGAEAAMLVQCIVVALLLDWEEGLPTSLWGVGSSSSLGSTILFV